MLTGADQLPQPLFQWVGHLGVACYLGSYGLLQAGMIRGTSLSYTLPNLAAAALVLLSLVVAFNLASVLIQVSWIAISMVGLARMVVQAWRIRLDPAEQALIDAAFGPIPWPMARRFLNTGVWHQSGPGSVLTDESQPVHALHFLSDGGATVRVAGDVVARISGGFVGEMNVMHSGPASATVALDTPSVLFTISGQSLRRLADRGSDFRLILDRALTRDTAAKPGRTNRRLATAMAADGHPRAMRP